MANGKTDDGKYIAYPEIQMIDGELTKLERSAALEKAVETGNFIEFPTDEEALEYAKGGYKTEKFNEFGRKNQAEEERPTVASGLDITLKKEDEFENDTLASRFIKSKEGFLPTPKWDVNHWTWGYGTAAPYGGNKDEPPPPYLTITRKDAQEELINYMKTEVLDNIEKFQEEFPRYKNWTDNQIDGLTSFMYNGKPNWLRQVTDNGTRTNEEIAEAMLLYHNVTIDGKLVPARGLIKRRKEEHDIFVGS